MLNQKSQNNFAKIRDIMFPVKNDELGIFVPVALMMFCILFNFSALRSLKDGLIIPNIGAEVISFIKMWVVLPSAVLFALLYAKLSNLFKPDSLYYYIVSSFLILIIIFTFFIYPNQEYFHPNPDLVSYYSQTHPYLQWPIKIIGKWSYVLIYVIAELWSAVVITLMFWQLANHIINTEQAKRFYPFFGVVGNLGLVLSGNIMVFFSNDLKDSAEDSLFFLKIITIFVSFFGFCSILIYKYISLNIIAADTIKFEIKKTKISFYESIKMIFSSKYLAYIAIMLISYGLAINLVEGPWKSKIRELYPTTVEYIVFMGRFNIWMGVSCVLFTVFGSYILRFGSWLKAALVTPIMLGVTGGMFFIFVVFADYMENTFINIWMINPVFVAICLGAIQNIVSKSTKYSLFDATKEMAYIPLDLEMKTKGKAAVDVIGTKLGKSTGALMQSFLFTLFPYASFDSITPYLMVVFGLVIWLWFKAVVALDLEYSKIQGGI